MTAFNDLLNDPFADRSYLVTVWPRARISGQIAAIAAGNRLSGPAGTFTGLKYGDRLETLGFGEVANQGWLVIEEVEAADLDRPAELPGGGWIRISGLTLADEAAGARLLQGQVVRYFSSHPLVTGPSEIPPDTIYDERVENALRYKRSMVDGDRIGGRSVPGFGDVQLHNTDGGLDHVRNWGWAGCAILVEMGGPAFARAEYGTIFRGLTAGSPKIDTSWLTIGVTDLQALLDRQPWAPEYQGTGALEGNVDAKGIRKRLRYGYLPHVELQLIGIYQGRWVYRLHDGPVAAYDAVTNPAIVRDMGVPLVWVAANPGPKEWTLDHANGAVIIGGDPDGTVTFTGKGAAELVDSGTAAGGAAASITLAASAFAIDGYYAGLPIAIVAGTGAGQTARISAYAGSTRVASTAPAWGVPPDATSQYEVGGYVESVAEILRQIVTTRVLLQSEPSTSSLLIGTGAKTLAIAETLPIGIGGLVLIEHRTAPGVWMCGRVTAWAAGSASVRVERAAGVGTMDDWTVTKLGLLPSEMDLASLETLRQANPARIELAIGEDMTVLEAFDLAADSIGAFYGFTRASIFEVGRFEAAEGDPDLAVDGEETLDLQRLPGRPPTWWLQMGYLPNACVLEGGDLAEGVGKNVVTNGTFDSGVGWTAGTGWAIASSKATATAGSGSDLSRSIELLVGETYVLETDITVTAGTLQPKIGAVSIGAAVAATGTIRREFVAATASTTIVFTKDAAFAGDIDAVAITVAIKTFLETDYRYTDAAMDRGIRAVFGPTAIDEKRPSQLVDLAAAEAERDRQFALFGVPRDVFVAPLKTQPFKIDVARKLALSDRRFGLNVSLGRVLAIDEDAGNNRATATTWI